MTVKELKDILATYPDDMQLITSLYSDYCDLEAPRLKEVLPRPSNRMYLSYYDQQHPEKPSDVTTVLYFDGN